MELTIDETQITKLTDLYNANDKKDDLYYTRMLKAQAEGNNTEAKRMVRFRQITQERERTLDDVLRILGLCVITDEDNPEGIYKIIKMH